MEITLGSVVGVAVSVLIAPARAHGHLREAAAETALLLAEIMTALEPAVRTGAPDLGNLPTRVQAALNALSTAAQEAAHERRSACLTIRIRSPCSAPCVASGRTSSR
jgi:hypothetical protein